MTKHVLGITALLLFCCGGSTAVTSGPEQSLSVEDAVTIHDFALYSPPRISPDGMWLAYTVSDNTRMRDVDEEDWARSGVPVYEIGTDIILINLRNGKKTNLTHSVGNNWGSSWSPDGRYLAFNSDRDGSGQAKVWLYDLNSSDLRCVSPVMDRMLSREIQWTPDSRNIIVASVPSDETIDQFVREFRQGTRLREQDDKSKDTILLYRWPPPENSNTTTDPWNLNLFLCDLQVVNIKSGAARPIVHKQRIGTYKISPDGSRLVYTRMENFERTESQQILFTLISVPLSGNPDPRNLSDHIRLRYDGTGFSWSPDSRSVAFRTMGPNEISNDCFVVDDEDRSRPRNVSLLGPHSQQYVSRTPVWDEDSKFLYFSVEGTLWRASREGGPAREIARISNRHIKFVVSDLSDRLWSSDTSNSIVVLAYDESGRQDGFYEVDPATSRSALLLEQYQCYTCRDSPEQHDLVILDPTRSYVVYFAEDAQHANDLWISERTFQRPRRLTEVNPQLSKYTFGASRLVEWLSDDGERLQGSLLLPPDFRNDKRYPLVVVVYGGERQSDRLNRFGGWGDGPFNMQLLVTRGFAVFLPDAPQNLGTPMADLAKTVLPGVNKLIELGVADPHRLGLFGQSYGGYSVLSLLVQTRRFKAAVEADGYADEIGSYGSMQMTGSAASVAIEESGQGLMGGPPWEHPLRYVQNSPIFYLDRVDTPLLILHGADDETVGAFLGDELFVGMRRLGKAVEYAKYRGENHYAGVWKYANQIDFATRMLRWFETYLQPVH